MQLVLAKVTRKVFCVREISLQNMAYFRKMHWPIIIYDKINKLWLCVVLFRKETQKRRIE